MKCLFVEADGTMGWREVRADQTTYLVPREMPMSVMVNEPIYLSVDVDTYTRRGELFDGRPVFCADGMTVEEVRALKIAAVRDLPHLDNDLKNETITYATRKYPDYIQLDAWCGEPPMAEYERADLRAQGLRKRAARLLLAARAPLTARR